jgi:hypothetical protein
MKARAAAAGGGLTGAVLLVVGCVGPWVMVGSAGFSGLDGVGWLLLACGLGAGALHVGVALGAIRWAALCSAFLAAACLVIAGLVTLAIHLAHHTASLLNFLLHSVNENGNINAPVSAGWGLHLVEFGAVLLLVSSVAAVIVPRPAGPRSQLIARLKNAVTSTQSQSDAVIEATPTAVDDLL